MIKPTHCDLSGKGILVTRPAHQALSLQQCIEKAGGHAWLLPTMEIMPVAEQDPLQQAIAQLGDMDMLIFTSPNAVHFSAPLIHANWPRLPSEIKLAAVGAGTAKALIAAQLAGDGRTVLYPTQQFGSEGLLAMPDLQQVAGKNITIFCGIGGRELLQEVLLARQAKVNSAFAYQQKCPKVDISPIVTAWHNKAIDIVISTSQAALRNLYQMLGDTGREYLQKTPLLVLHSRHVAVAYELGYQLTPLVADDASDAAIMQALLAWQKDQKV